MTSKNIIIENKELAEENHENRNVYPTDRVHPKVTTKKTFSDIHRNRRLNINSEITETDGSIHPKIEWSAGTTDVGTPQGPTDSKRMIFDPKVPILLPNQAITNTILGNTKRPPPPVPNPWGSIDVQPTQPEEIIHLITPSGVVGKTNTSRDTAETRARKSFVDKFRKNAAKVIAAKKFEPRRLQEKGLPKENLEIRNPEEEFESLNERFVREGYLPKDFKSNFSPETSTQGTAQQEQLTIQREPNEPEINKTPLPARRSCEPQDVKDLRKLRDSDSQPGSSRDAMSRRETGTSQTGDQLFPTSNFLDSENGGVTKNTRTDYPAESNETRKNGDRFKIENPFSDFSLQTLSRNKVSFKLDLTEMDTIPRYLDPTEPSTSQRVSSIEAFRSKVSPNDIVENPESETRESDFIQPQESRMKKTSFLDTPVTILSSETLISRVRKKRMNFECASNVWNDLDQLDNTWALGPSFQRILGENFVSSCAPAKFYEFDEEIMQFEHLSKALRTNVIDKIAEKISNHVPITDNFVKFRLINYLKNSFPVIIFNPMKTLRICRRNIGTDYLQFLEKNELSRVGELLAMSQGPKEYSVLPENPISDLCRQGNIVDRITRYVVNVILSENSADEYSFLYFNTMTAFTNHFNGIKCVDTWASHIQPNNRRIVLIERENTLFVDYFEKFFNFRQSS